MADPYAKALGSSPNTTTSLPKSSETQSEEAIARLSESIAEVMDEDGGCWSPCSGCQESVDGCVSTKDYPYSDIFKCQPGAGCRECGGIGVLWQDGAFLRGWADFARDDLAAALSPPPEQHGESTSLIALRVALEQRRLRDGYFPAYIAGWNSMLDWALQEVAALILTGKEGTNG